MGHMPDSRLIATGLGAMHRYLCAAPSYLDRQGSPQTIEDLKHHTTIEMPGVNGMPRSWIFHKNNRDVVKFGVPPRLLVNDPGVIYRLAVNGAGIACIAGYLSGPEIAAGRLVRLFPEWALPPVEVNAVYPSNRELSPVVRAFVEHIKKVATSGQLWMDDPIARLSNISIGRKLRNASAMDSSVAARANYL